MKVIVFCLLVVQVLAIATGHGTRKYFIVRRSLEDTLQDASRTKEQGHDHQSPKIYEMRVDANITNRFAHAMVTSKVKNYGNTSQEAVFSINLPKKAFITKFVMSIGNKDYEAYVKEKEQAKQIYDQAVSSGLGAGLVASETRESNRFTVTVNVEPESKAIFHLTYEQLLERQDNQYELIVNIHPKQPVKDLTVYVNINESRPLRFVKAPSIRSGNEISEVNGDLDSRAAIHYIDPKSAVIKFSPNLERQKELAKTLETNVDEGLSGQFVVQYDVERSANGGEVLLDNGYFVHFFAPTGIEPLPKYVLFVLDTSYSMSGREISQVKTAMKSIFNELRTQDKFHLIDFNSIVKVLNLDNSSASVVYSSRYPYGYDSHGQPEILEEKNFVGSYSVTPDNMKKANKVIEEMYVSGATNIFDALKVALHLVDREKEVSAGDSAQPMIIFLTDGQANVGISSSSSILHEVQKLNVHLVPIYSLSFGEHADKDLLQKLSLRNNGFSTHIYAAADASLQLQNFYKHISSPTLNNVTFKYIEEAKNLTNTKFPILFGGSELVVVGRFDEEKEFGAAPKILGHGIQGPIELVANVTKSVSRLERLWAYLTIQQLLDNMEKSDNKTAYEKMALDIALKYSFVTPLSSLIVVKPNSTDSSVELLPADKVSDQSYPSSGYSHHYSASSTPLRTYHNYMPPDQYISSSYSHHHSMPTFLRFGGGSYSGSYSYNSLKPMKTSSIARIIKTTSTTVIPIITTPSTTILITSTEELKSRLSWLNDILNNDVITTSEGNFKLGLNETSTGNVTCQTTPKGEPGLCKLLRECPSVHSLLTTVDIFEQYRCDMREFAAVCCPKTDINN